MDGVSSVYHHLLFWPRGKPFLGRQLLQASQAPHDTGAGVVEGVRAWSGLLRQNTLSWMDTWIKLCTALSLVLVYTPGSFTSET